MSWFDVIGFAGAGFVITSLAMRSKVKMRLLAIVGSLLLGIYGVLIAAWPVTIANVVFAVVNVMQLRRDLGPGTHFTAVPIEAGAPFLADYLGGNADDVANSQPEYHPSQHDTFIRLINRDGLPAGILIGEPAGQELLIKLDYVTPAYRDSTQARWLFGPGRAIFTDAGFTRLVAHAHTSVHRNYLELLGFQREGSAYVLDL